MRLSVRKYFNIWKTFFSNSLTRDMEFKANFISNIGVDLIYYMSLYLFYHVIFQFQQLHKESTYPYIIPKTPNIL